MAEQHFSAFDTRSQNEQKLVKKASKAWHLDVVAEFGVLIALRPQALFLFGTARAALQVNFHTRAAAACATPQPLPAIISSASGRQFKQLVVQRVLKFFLGGHMSEGRPHACGAGLPAQTCCRDAACQLDAPHFEPVVGW